MTGQRPRAIVLRRYPDEDGHVPSARELDAWRIEVEAKRAAVRAARRRARRRRDRLAMLAFSSPWILLALLIVVR